MPDHTVLRTCCFVLLACSLQLSACARPSPQHQTGSPPDGVQSLMAAVKANDASAVRAVLRTGVDPNLHQERHAQQNTEPPAQAAVTPLVMAIREGHDNAAEALLESGADPNLRETGLEWGETPLMTASRLGRHQLVTLLLRHGADHSLRVGPYDARGRNVLRLDALSYAVIHGHVSIVETLLLAGASATTEHLARAIVAARTDIAYLLLATGVNPRLVSTRGRTAMQEALLLPVEKRSAMVALIEEFLQRPVY